MTGSDTRSPSQLQELYGGCPLNGTTAGGGSPCESLAPTNQCRGQVDARDGATVADTPSSDASSFDASAEFNETRLTDCPTAFADQTVDTE